MTNTPLAVTAAMCSPLIGVRFTEVVKHATSI